MYDSIHSFMIRSIDEISDFMTMFRSNFPITLPDDDLIASAVFVDLTRDPIALISKFRSNNFTQYDVEYYNTLKYNYQYISDQSLIRRLMDEPNYIVIDDVDDLEDDEIGDYFEKEFMRRTGWKTSIFHSLFHDELVYGYIVVFSLKHKIPQVSINNLTNFFSKYMSTVCLKLLAPCYMWKSSLYKKDVKEIEDNLSDFTIAITGQGIIVRANELTSYYLGLMPIDILGKPLASICPELSDGIKKSMTRDKDKELPINVTMTNVQGNECILELQCWKSTLTTDNTIVCFAKDITVLDMIS